MDGYEARLAKGRMTSTNSCFKKTNHNLPRKTPVPTLGLIKARVSPGLFGVLLQYLQQSRKEAEGEDPPSCPSHSWVASNQSEQERPLYLGKKSKHNWTTNQQQQKQNSFVYNIPVCLSACGLNKFFSVFHLGFSLSPQGVRWAIFFLCLQKCQLILDSSLWKIASWSQLA